MIDIEKFDVLYLPWAYFEPEDEIYSQKIEIEYGECGSEICRYQEQIAQFLGVRRSTEIVNVINMIPKLLAYINRLEKAYLEEHQSTTFYASKAFNEITTREERKKAANESLEKIKNEV
jgi:hypothetical protein